MTQPKDEEKANKCECHCHFNANLETHVGDKNMNDICPTQSCEHCNPPVRKSEGKAKRRSFITGKVMSDKDVMYTAQAYKSPVSQSEASQTTSEWERDYYDFLTRNGMPRHQAQQGVDYLKHKLNQTRAEVAREIKEIMVELINGYEEPDLLFNEVCFINKLEVLRLLDLATEPEELE